MADVQDAPSASPDQPEPDFASFEAATLASLGTQFQPTKAADTAPAKPVEQAASTDAIAKPASEPGKKDKGAKARIAELNPEIATLEERLRYRAELKERLARSEKDDQPADPSPAPPKPPDPEEDIAQYEALPGWPKEENYQDYGRLLTARAKFIFQHESQQSERTAQQAREQRQAQEADARSLAKGIEEFPDFVTVVQRAFEAGRKFPKHVIDEIRANEEDGHRIVHALAQGDDALYARIADPIQFGRYVERVLGQPAPPKKFVPQKTSAPDPPVTLGSHLTDAPDAERAAVAAGDFTSFEAALMSKLRTGA